MLIQVYNLNAIVFELLLAPASAALVLRQVPLTPPIQDFQQEQSWAGEHTRPGLRT